MLLVYTIVEPAAKYGWGAGRTLGLGAVALALLAAFIVREATAANPLIPLRIFRSRNISGANAVQALSSPACSACSSSAPCTCSTCSATTRCRPAWRSCPRRS